MDKFFDSVSSALKLLGNGSEALSSNDTGNSGTAFNREVIPTQAANILVRATRAVTNLKRNTPCGEYVRVVGYGITSVAEDRGDISDNEASKLRNLTTVVGDVADGVETVLNAYDNRKRSSKPTSSGTHAHSSGTKKTSGKSSSFPEGIDEETAQALKDLDFKGDRLPGPGDIKLQYRRCCREYHPDQNHDVSKERKKFCKQKIKDITAAYTLLKEKGLVK